MITPSINTSNGSPFIEQTFIFNAGVDHHITSTFVLAFAGIKHQWAK